MTSPTGSTGSTWPRRWSAVEVSTLVGGLVWLELRLFEVVGGWATGGELAGPTPDVQERLATVSFHHSWRAEILRPRIHRFDGVEPVDRIAAPGPVGSELLGALAAGQTSAGRFAAYSGVMLPGLAAMYRHLLAGCTVVSDGPTVRWATKALEDVTVDWQDAVTFGFERRFNVRNSPEIQVGESAQEIPRSVAEVDRAMFNYFAAWRTG